MQTSQDLAHALVASPVHLLVLDPTVGEHIAAFAVLDLSEMHEAFLR